MIRLHEGRKKIELSEQWDYGVDEAVCEFVYESDTENEKIFLRFEGASHLTGIWMNQVYLGKHGESIHSFEFDVTGLVRNGEKNKIVVKTDKDIAVCLWDNAQLVIRPEVYIEYCKIYTKTVLKKDCLGDQQDKPDGSAMVCLDVTLHNMSHQTVADELSAFIKPYNFTCDDNYKRSRKVVIPPGRSIVKFVITVTEAKLWWTWDYGFPHLYNLKLNYAGDSIDMKFGIKDIEYNQKLGSWYLNSRRIFLRGVNYGTHTGTDEANKIENRQTIEAMVKMNINSVRMGNHMVKEEIYTSCDELGVLVWQVFPLEGEEKDYNLMAKNADLIRKVGMLLTNHACVGMWSVGNDILKETLKCVDSVRWVHCLTDTKSGADFMHGAGQEENADLSDYILPPNVLGAAEYKNRAASGAKEASAYLRQHKYYPVSAMYLYNWDSTGSMIGGSYTKVFISLEPCMHPYRLGQEKEFKKGTTFTARVWVNNDGFSTIADAELEWKVKDLETHEIVAGHRFKRTILADSAEIPDHIVLPLKECFAGHRFRVLMSIVSENAGILSENFCEFKVTN